VHEDAFRRALEASLAWRFADARPGDAEVAAYLDSLHVEDLGLACACAAGDERAWEHFVREFRPVLYRCAAAAAPPEQARDLAHSLYAELFGLTER
jgi:hypothetical protein